MKGISYLQRKLSPSFLTRNPFTYCKKFDYIWEKNMDYTCFNIISKILSYEIIISGIPTYIWLQRGIILIHCIHFIKGNFPERGRGIEKQRSVFSHFQRGVVLTLDIRQQSINQSKVKGKIITKNYLIFFTRSSHKSTICV